jgi:hypothetical protein
LLKADPNRKESMSDFTDHRCQQVLQFASIYATHKIAVVI